jgi:hypothetical protein
MLNTLFSLLEVLVVLVPMLLAIAFMTIIERKQLAAMQRRTGPNIVGIKHNNLKNLIQIKRFLHSSSDYNNEIIRTLYTNRIAPVKLFDSEVIETCYNFTSTKQRVLFFKKFEDKGGVYLIQFKEDSSIYYIGTTKNFKKRLNAHLKTTVKDKFHLFANLLGWNKFKFSIVEVCDINNQKNRENYYLQKYLPLLNTVFKSNFSDSQISETLYSKLKTKQKNLKYENKYIGISVFVYSYNNDKISNNYIKYNSINTLSKEINVARETIKLYLNANVPYKNHLFYNEAIYDFDLTNNLVCKAKKGLDLNRTVPKKILVYSVSAEMLKFDSKEAAARFLNVKAITITNHVDKWIKGGINGYYLFSRELNDIEKDKLIELSNSRKTNNCEVWVYEANNLESIYGTFNSMQKAADHFNIDYRSVLRHLDTNKATLKKDKLVLFYSKKLTLEHIKNIKVAKIKNETVKLWIYKQIDNKLSRKLVLINDNQPTFNSKYIAAKQLKISHKTISKYLDTNKSYNNLFFYSKKI